MIIMEIHNIVKDEKVVATLRIYLEGSGNPCDVHNIKAVSIDGYGVGEIPELYKVDRFENMEEFKV